MLHRVLASLLCVLGAAAVALGIASATAWRADDVLVARATAAEGTTMIVTEPGVLDLAADEVTVTATAPRGDVVIALGRSGDVDAWVGTDAHTRVTGLSAWHELATSRLARTEATPTPGATPGATPTADAAAAPTPTPTPEPTAAAGDAAATDGATPADPRGSDLWVTEKSGTGKATLSWTRTDGRWSVLVAATEAGVAPTVSLAWPQVVTTPWLVPGVVAGSVLLLAGVAWWVMILLAGRRPRRRAPEPTPVVVAPAEPGAPLTRRQLREMAEQQSRRGRAGRPEHGGGAVGRREAPPSAPPAEPTPPPVVPPSRGTTPSASADAWRRAWGLGATPPPGPGATDHRPDDQPPTTGGVR